MKSQSAISRRRAMNTLFEIMVVGANLENLTAAAEAALDEIERIDNLLSRFDRTSEIFRINRQAAVQPVLVDYEVLQILESCFDYWKTTDGHFDITATSASNRKTIDPHAQPFPQAVQIDRERRTVRFTASWVQLDFGAFGKGYALDRAAKLMNEYGVEHALLHGGTSSVLAMGLGPDGEPWRIGLRNPYDQTSEIDQISLINQGLSSSAVFAGEEIPSDIINPQTKKKLNRQASCTVVANSAAEAEVFSTALLSMGKAAAAAFCSTHPIPGLAAAWIAKTSGAPTADWFINSLWRSKINTQLAVNS